MNKVTTSIKVGCPRCESEDCLAICESIGELIRLPLEKLTMHCPRCGFKKVAMLANRRVLCEETREPGDEDTEVVYAYLGKEH